MSLNMTIKMPSPVLVESLTHQIEWKRIPDGAFARLAEGKLLK
jgi:hypothetical protein